MTGELLLTLAGGASLFAWLVLTFGHGRFWLGDQRLGGDPPAPDPWPAVAAVIPARDEADVIAQTLGAVLSQDYPGPFHVVLVDDESSDGTADAARKAADSLGRAECLEILQSKPRPEGWVGKVWALHTGIEHVKGVWPETDFLWLSDADVAPAERTLRRLVAKACAERLDLVSLMVKLHCKRGWERLLVPAFVYFFQKLYPFPRVNDPRSRTAGAAGGCVIVGTEALARAGGIEAIRGEIIDDCALGQRIKQGGGIWLGLGTEEHGVRPYAGIGEIWDMVARSAYTQLGHSPLLLLGTLVGLLLIYATPPALLLAWPLHASAPAALLGGAAWLAMAVTFLPTLVLYGRTPLLAAALPIAGTLYAGMTLDSALRHHRGEGGRWKGRVGAGRAIVLALMAATLGATSPAFADPPELEPWQQNPDGAIEAPSFAVALDYPSGTCAYYTTIDGNDASAYPFSVRREYRGMFATQLLVGRAAVTYTDPVAGVPALPSKAGHLALVLASLEIRTAC